MEISLLPLKIKLQQLGALRPEAWNEISASLQIQQLKTGESFLRISGEICFVLSGLLKEYQVTGYRKPVLINFLTTTQIFYSNNFKIKQYLKAETDTVILSLHTDKLEALHHSFPELKVIYDQLCYEYDEQLAFRQMILEMPNAERIHAARIRFKDVFPYLKKKDIANYLHISYNYLLHMW